MVSYRNYCLHMGSQHGVLERIMESDYRPEIQELQLALVEAGHGHKGIVGCRFSNCQGIQFNRESSRELKLPSTWSSPHDVSAKEKVGKSACGG